MHKNILKSYSLYQTRIDTLLANGRYNCVSSSVLYTILCKAFGISTSGVMTKDHAFVIVHINGENIDVETTNQYGFDPGNRKEFHDEFGRLTGFSYVPVQNYRARHNISQIELVSLILNNRISDHERNNRYAEAVPIAIDRAALLAGDALTVNNASGTKEDIFVDPRFDLMDRLFNFGAMLLSSGREEDALRWAAAASPLYPEEDRWQEFTMAAVNNSVTKLMMANKITDARNFLDRYKELLSKANYNQLDFSLIDTELLRSANQIRTEADGNTIINSIDIARNKGAIKEARAAELTSYAVLKTAEILSNSPGRNWRAAAIYIENAVTRFGTNADFEKALSGYRSNIVADYHNTFAAEWNKRNYTQAEKILNEALAEFPNNQQLLRNKELVDRHFSR